MTQRERVLNYIEDFGSITRIEAFFDLGIFELPARICELEKEGYKFKKSQHTTKNRYGERIRFTRYRLEEENAGNGQD